MRQEILPQCVKDNWRTCHFEDWRLRPVVRDRNGWMRTVVTARGVHDGQIYQYPVSVDPAAAHVNQLVDRLDDAIKAAVDHICYSYTPHVEGVECANVACEECYA